MKSIICETIWEGLQPSDLVDRGLKQPPLGLSDFQLRLVEIQRRSAAAFALLLAAEQFDVTLGTRLRCGLSYVSWEQTKRDARGMLNRQNRTDIQLEFFLGTLAGSN